MRAAPHWTPRGARPIFSHYALSQRRQSFRGRTTTSSARFFYLEGEEEKKKEREKRKGFDLVQPVQWMTLSVPLSAGCQPVLYRPPPSPHPPVCIRRSRCRIRTDVRGPALRRRSGMRTGRRVRRLAETFRQLSVKAAGTVLCGAAFHVFHMFRDQKKQQILHQQKKVTEWAYLKVHRRVCFRSGVLLEEGVLVMDGPGPEVWLGSHCHCLVPTKPDSGLSRFGFVLCDAAPLKTKAALSQLRYGVMPREKPSFFSPPPLTQVI